MKKYLILDLENPHTPPKQKIDFEANIEDKTFEAKDLTKINFDKIFCLEVSLYWTNPTQALENIVKLMSHDTLLYINFHQYYRNQKPDGLDNLRYSYYSIQNLIKTNNLKLVEIHFTRISFLSKLFINLFWKSERMRPNKSYIFNYISSFLLVVRVND